VLPLQRDLSCTGVHKQKLMQLLGPSRSAAFDSSICFVREFGFMAVSFFHLWLVFWEDGEQYFVVFLHAIEVTKSSFVFIGEYLLLLP